MSNIHELAAKIQRLPFQPKLLDSILSDIEEFKSDTLNGSLENSGNKLVHVILEAYLEAVKVNSTPPYPEANVFRVFESFCRLGGKLDVTDASGLSLLHLAIYSPAPQYYLRYFDAMKALFELFSQYNFDFKCTNLHSVNLPLWAARKRCFNLISLLSDYGSDLNKADNGMQTGQSETVFDELTDAYKKELPDSSAALEFVNNMQGKTGHPASAISSAQIVTKSTNRAVGAIETIDLTKDLSKMSLHEQKLSQSEVIEISEDDPINNDEYQNLYETCKQKEYTWFSEWIADDFSRDKCDEVLDIASKWPDKKAYVNFLLLCSEFKLRNPSVEYSDRLKLAIQGLLLMLNKVVNKENTPVTVSAVTDSKATTIDVIDKDKLSKIIANMKAACLGKGNYVNFHKHAANVSNAQEWEYIETEMKKAKMPGVIANFPRFIEDYRKGIVPATSNATKPNLFNKSISQDEASKTVSQDSTSKLTS